MAVNPQFDEFRFAGSSAACGQAGRGSRSSGRPLGVLAGLPDLLDHEPDSEIVVCGTLAGYGAGSRCSSTTGPPWPATCRSPTWSG